MSKKLCKLVKDDYLEENIKAYIELIGKPKFVCKKCGRASENEDHLCKSKKMK